MGSVETVNKKDLMKLTSAFIMGDGGVYYSGRECRYVRNQNEVHRDYLEWQMQVLSEITFCDLSPVKDDRPNRKPNLSLRTHSHPTFTKIRKRLYIDKYKSVDPHYLKMLDWQMLACLYMDDGSLSVDSRCNATPTARLNTKRLSYGDSWLLQKTIKDRLNVQFNVHRHYDKWFLALRAKDSERFLTNIEPHLFASFNYKLPCSCGMPRQRVMIQSDLHGNMQRCQKCAA